MSGFQSIRIFLLKDMLLTRVREIFVIKQINNTMPWTYLIIDLNGEEIIGSFYEKELKKTKKEFRIEKGKETNYMSNGKDITTHLIAGLIKRILQNESVLSTIQKFWKKH